MRIVKAGHMIWHVHNEAPPFVGGMDGSGIKTAAISSMTPLAPLVPASGMPAGPGEGGNTLIRNSP